MAAPERVFCYDQPSMKPTVYIETTILGHLTSRLPKDPIIAGNMVATRRWWLKAADRFDLVTAKLVLSEASQGDPEAAADRLRAAANLRIIPPSPAAEAIAALLVARGALPQKARVDAFHVAIAAVNGIEYLATWNCRHLANATMRLKIRDVCQEGGFKVPVICTPLELSQELP
jgi:predicted nucleic acid-binding protein